MDLISRLAERALGRARFLEPLRPPIFAPVPERPFTAESPAESLRLTNPADETVASQSASNSAPVLAAEPTKQGAVLKTGRTSARDRAAGSTVASKKTVSDARQKVRQPQAAVSSETSQTVELAHSAAARQKRSPRATMTVTRLRGRNGAACLAGKVKANEKRLSERGPVEAGPAPGSRTVTEELSHLRTVFSRADVPQRSASVRQALVPVPAGKREPGPPQVKVTIGRVEVRAVTPPVPAAPPLRPGPKLTLERYLEQRNRGER